MSIRRLAPILLAMLAAVPGTALRLAGVHLDPPVAAALSGLAILGASFLLLWACDVAQADISRALALAVVALIAVLPEYAVDMYFTWQAGKNPESNYAQYAIANMTGANRLLIGVAWGLIAVLYWFRYRRSVQLHAEQRTEIRFLGMATAYAFVIPLKGTLAWYDGVVFLVLYAWYMTIAAKRPAEESEPYGTAEMLMRLPKVPRRLSAIGLFLYAAGVILANAESFCEGLIGTGKVLHINEFLLVQWLAPIASEAPEFIVAILFAWRGQGAVALGSLLSSKLNQWTLLVGMIPGVFALAHGSLDHPIPMGHYQMQEIMLTAAQSILAVAILASLRLTVPAALLLFGLFAGQFVLPGLMRQYPYLESYLVGLHPEAVHPLFTLFYVVATAAIVLYRPRAVWKLIRLDMTEPELPESRAESRSLPRGGDYALQPHASTETSRALHLPEMRPPTKH